MAKWIKEKFSAEIPDGFMCPRTENLVAEYEYEGPRKFAVMIHKETNSLSWYRGCMPITEGKQAEEEWERIEIFCGVEYYPVVLDFYKNPLLLLAMTDNRKPEEIPLRKEWYVDGTSAVVEKKDEGYWDDNIVSIDYYPPLPSNVIELGSIFYDPETEEFTDINFKTPQVSKKEFAWLWLTQVAEAKNYIDDILIDKHPDEQRSMLLYYEKLRSIFETYKNYLDRYWLIPMPSDPRGESENCDDYPKYYQCWCVYAPNGNPLLVTDNMLIDLMEKADIKIPEEFLTLEEDIGVTTLTLPS